MNKWKIILLFYKYKSENNIKLFIIYNKIPETKPKNMMELKRNYKLWS